MTRSSIACVLALLAATSLQAQTGPAQVAPLTDAIPVAVGETQSHHLLNPEVRLFNPDGTVLETTRLAGSPGGFTYPFFQVVAMDPAGRLSAVWAQTLSSGCSSSIPRQRPPGIRCSYGAHSS